MHLLDPFDEMVDDEASILCHSVGRAGSIYRKNAVWIGDGINCRMVHFAIGNNGDVMVPAELGRFRWTFEPSNIEVAGHPIIPCH